MLTLISAMQLKKPEIFMLNFNLPLERTCFPWADLLGHTENISKIQNQILLPLKQHLLTSKKSSHNFPSTKILLFHGIRSSGKSFMAKTLGAELKRIYWDTKWKNLQTYYVHSTDLLTSTLDDTKNKMSRIFQRIQQQSASDSQPSFLIIDDLHKLFSSSSSSSVSQDRLILDHLCTCIEHLKMSGSGRGTSQPEGSKVGGSGPGNTTYVVLIMNTNVSAPFNFLQLSDHLDLDLSLPFYTMDKPGRLDFFQRVPPSLNPCPLFQLSTVEINLLVQNTLGFTSCDLFQLKHLAVVQASAAAAKKLASHSKSKSGKGGGADSGVGAEDWLRALHHFHSHGQSHRLQNILLTPSNQVSMSFETAFQILTCPQVVTPLLQLNLDLIVNLIKSKIRVYDKIVRGRDSDSRSTAGPFSNMSSSSAGLLVNPDEPSFSEDPGLPAGSELSLSTRILYLHIPNESQGQGQMSIEFVNKYLIPAAMTSRNHMPSFVIHGEAVISQNIPPFVVINMLKEARQFESPCFLIINSLDLLISHPKFRLDVKNFASELSKCAHNCGSSNNIFLIASSTVEISKLPPCLQDIFHGYQNCYRLQNTTEQEIWDFLHQAFFDPEPSLSSNHDPGCQIPGTTRKTTTAVENPSAHNSEQRRDGSSSHNTYNNNVNNSLINLSLLLNQNKNKSQNSDPDPNSEAGSSSAKTVTTIKRPSAGFSKNGSCDDTSVLQSRRETSRRKFSYNNNPDASVHGKDSENPRENEQIESPSNKIIRLDPHGILDRAVAVAVKMNQKSVIWFYEDLMRVKRAEKDNQKILKHQEQIVKMAEAQQTPPEAVGTRSSSRNLSSSSRSTNQRSLSAKNSNQNLSKPSPSAGTRSTRKKSKSDLNVEANKAKEDESNNSDFSDASATTDEDSDDFRCE